MAVGSFEILSCYHVVTEALSIVKCVWNEVEIVTDLLLVRHMNYQHQYY